MRTSSCPECDAPTQHDTASCSMCDRRFCEIHLHKHAEMLVPGVIGGSHFCEECYDSQPWTREDTSPLRGEGDLVGIVQRGPDEGVRSQTPADDEIQLAIEPVLRLDYTGIVAWAWPGESLEIGALVLSPGDRDDDLFFISIEQGLSRKVAVAKLPVGERYDPDAVMRLVLRYFRAGDMFFQNKSLSSVFVPVDSPIADTAFYPFSVAMREGHLRQPFTGDFDDDRFMTWWRDVSDPRFAETTFRRMQSDYVSVGTTRLDLHAKLEEEPDRGAAIIARFKAHTAAMSSHDCERFWTELDRLMPGEIIRLALGMAGSDRYEDRRIVRSYDGSDAFHEGSAQLEQQGWAIESATSRWDGGWDVTYERSAA